MHANDLATKSIIYDLFKYILHRLDLYCIHLSWIIKRIFCFGFGDLFEKVQQKILQTCRSYLISDKRKTNHKTNDFNVILRFSHTNSMIHQNESIELWHSYCAIKKA